MRWPYRPVQDGTIHVFASRPSQTLQVHEILSGTDAILD